jgi:pyruvate/2-oxoglutarate dehydrogenase complex dihydrolipoamide dehydrogenase (E3) component
MSKVDAIIVGAGQAGPSLANRLSGAGLRTAVIERRHLGGTCVNYGCIPTKTLIASARAAYVARRGAEFGVKIPGPITVDMKRVKERKDDIVFGFRQGLEEWLRGMANVTMIRGHARFEGPHQLRVDDKLLEADKIFLNLGGRPQIPPISGITQVKSLTNTSMMEVDFLPEHLVIIGGSYIALEFAQMYRRFGSAVTVIERGPRLLARDDEDVAIAVRSILEEEGVDVVVNADIVRVEEPVGRPLIHLRDGSVVRGSHLLLATGRMPNTEDLALDKAGIAVDARGYIVVDDELVTSVPGVWALGDCNGRGGFTHTSFNDYEIVAANLFDERKRKVSDRIPAYALYVDPPLGRVGMTEAEVRKEGRKALVGRMPMARVSRAKERGETSGLMKILVDEDSREILGAAILGLHGDEVIHCILDVMYAKAPYTVLRDAMHIHPTVAEFLPTLVQSLEPLT